MTSFRIGGPAERFAAPRSVAELRRLLARAAGEGIPVRAMGAGRNLLVDDRGVEGLVISLARLRRITRCGNLLVAEAGAGTTAFVNRAVREGLAGFECLVGVPGTMGGAVRMNAGGRHGALGDRVVWVSGLTRTGEPWRFGRGACGFRYRGSGLGGTFVTEVAVEMTPSGADLAARRRAIFAAKRATQPLFAATAGCMFRNPSLPGGESAGWLLDRAGAKGLRAGGAVVSPLHANFIVNRGGATFADVMSLIRTAHRMVRDRFGVDLALEVEIWARTREEEVWAGLSA